MQLEFTQSPEPARRYLKLWYFCQFIVTLIILSAALTVWFYNDMPFYGTYIFIGLVLIDILYYLIHPILLYRYYHYRVTDSYIEIQKNWWFKRNEVIQIERIQYVRRKTGPLMRWFQLNRLSFYTAGHELVLPLLYDDTITEIESFCLTQLKGGDSDV
ncbi:hypothetical protein EAF16_07975 [Staphylococcus pseudintermedius]|uniref:PH domain-containing protein n=1 Tax=Staphylococcus pseudintermedius TaxID=283734 RepID=UPI000C6FE113|nr:PH domain-containing protein [Staphylococcus pseudintermedius]EGQ1664095.1 hypothetical protein [Staphylococcus pseudintermedius]EGQ2941074.1 hypothetical protein [Staphylococcus pseudintermedius]EGQ3117250.1 PH domain-containing protein [Staphylococcus pseudintermedius]EGQ3298485.1 PH domain-containing protein [Staphylococcus pseudintermedius]EGQ3504910.1 PH domain-containing protein [Staphylococcus pseudintermedius]